MTRGEGLTFDRRAVLNRLSGAPGNSGSEGILHGSASSVTMEMWKPLAHRVWKDSLGNVVALMEADHDAPRVMLAAHIDQVGLMVSSVEDGGFVRIVPVGNIDPRILPGQEVVVWGKRPLYGIISALTNDKEEGATSYEELFVDVGLGGATREHVRAGDSVILSGPSVNLMGERMAGRAMDNRVGVTVVAECLWLLGQMPQRPRVLAVATVQEEVGLRGAKVGAYSLEPDLALAVDVTHGDAPDVPEHLGYRLGKGPAICTGGNVHPAIFQALKEKAQRLGIPYQVEVIPGYTGTDAWAIQTAREGIPTGVVSIPCRYMHSTVETIDLDDMKWSASLLAETVAAVDEHFIEGLAKWF